MLFSNLPPPRAYLDPVAYQIFKIPPPPILTPSLLDTVEYLTKCPHIQYKDITTVFNNFHIPRLG